MKKYIIFSGLMLYAFTSFSQGLLVNGAHIVVGSGAYLVTDGEDGNITTADGVFDLSGTIMLDGDFLNNTAADDAFGTLVTGSRVVFAGDKPQIIGGNSSAVFSFDQLDVVAGADVRVMAGKQLTLTGDLTNNGTFTLQSTNDEGVATLLANSSLVGTGTYNMEAYLTAGRNWYVSSPMTNAKAGVLSASARTIYWYDEAHGSTAPWASVTDDNTNLEPLRGYIATVGSDGITTFTGGTYYNGDQLLTMERTAGQTKEGFHLVGNPYPAYFDFENATRNNILPTFWYRSRNAACTSYVFDTYNAACCEGISLSGKTVTKHIPPMQAFWVRVSPECATGTIQFSKINAHHKDFSGNHRRIAALADRKLVRLQVSNGQNFDETLLVFNAQASDGYDAYDSPKMSNANVAIPELYSKAGGEVLAINGFSAFDSGRRIPVGFSTGQENKFFIRAAELSGFDNTVQVKLVDKQEGLEFDMTEGNSYSFSSKVANTIDRFELIFKTVGNVTDVLPVINQSLHFYRLENRKLQIKIGGSVESGGNARIFNSAGIQLAIQPINTSVVEMNFPYPPGVYLVRAVVPGCVGTHKLIVE